MNAINEILQQFQQDRMSRRLAMTIVGLVLTALSISTFRLLQWGVDPFTCFVEGWENMTGLSYGTVFPVVQAVLLVITFFLGRKYIGLGTIISLFGIGTMVDLFDAVLASRAPV